MERGLMTEYRKMEQIGDALYNFLCTRHIIEQTQEGFKVNQNTLSICKSNLFMGGVGIRLKLKPHPAQMEDVATFGDSYPKYADALEVKIWTEFIEGGLPQAENYFKEHVAPCMASRFEIDSVREYARIFRGFPQEAENNLNL